MVARSCEATPSCPMPDSPPAVSIDQKSTSHNPRSTVGTVTEIYDYLRLLYARVGIPHCPTCGREVVKQSAQEIVDQVAALPDGSRTLILAPLVRGRKGTYQSVFEEIRKAGFARVRVDGDVVDVAPGLVQRSPANDGRTILFP